MNEAITEIKKVVGNSLFPLAVFAVIVICFTADAYTDVDYGLSYSVFDVMTKFSREEILESGYELNPVSICLSGMSGYGMLFAPIVVSLPFTYSFLSERRSLAVGMYQIRETRQAYGVSKAVSGMVGAFLCMFTGFLIYSAIVTAVFPPMSAFGDEVTGSMYPNGVLRTVLLTAVYSGIYGVVISMPSLIFSAVFSNRYVVTCVPFMVFFIWKIILTRVPVTNEKTQRLVNAMSTEQIPLLSLSSDTKGIAIQLGFSAVFTFLSVMVFELVMINRTDMER